MTTPDASSPPPSIPVPGETRLLPRTITLPPLTPAQGTPGTADTPAEPAGASSTSGGGAHRETVGPYEIVRELGRGGMGVVYLARDPRLHRQLAIKMLSGDPGCDIQKARATGLCFAATEAFRQEARHLAAVEHPNIATIYSIEEDGPVTFLTLQYVPGEDLTAYLGELSLEDTLRIGLQICLGLEAAHERNIIHCDLKPQNIKITPEGAVKILDFGIARAAHSSRSEEDEVAGTPGYMSPEQIRGEPLGPTTDIWALGCLLYECLTGSNPFRKTTLKTSVDATLHEQPNFDDLPAGLPAEFADALRATLNKDSRQRTPHVVQLRKVIEDALLRLVQSSQPLRDLAQSSAEVLGQAAGIGDEAPQFVLEREGRFFESHSHLPLVVFFYRGKW